jgi:site-specific DNA-methyltransferase (adenine-specific)
VDIHDLRDLTERVLAQKARVIETGLLHLESCTELGRLLVEARGRIPARGGWFTYLDSVGIQQDRAQNYMMLARYSEDLRSSSPSDLTVTAALEWIRQHRAPLADGAHSDAPPFDFKHAAFLAPLTIDERRTLAASPDFSSTPIAELYRRRRAAKQEADQLSAAIAVQRAQTRSGARVAATVVPDSSDEEIRVALAEQLPWTDGSIDLVVTSPPYCLGDKVPYADGGDYDDYRAYRELTERWAAELLRVVNPEHGRLCLDVPIDTDRGGWRPLAHHWQSALEAAGWQYRTTIEWNKGQGGSGTDRGSIDSAGAPNVTAPVENILVYYRGTWRRDLQLEERQSDLSHDEWLEWCGPRGVWDFPGEHDDGHPAVFPDELARRCIKLFSLVGDVVGDPFCGRGTTPRVAAALNRRVRAVDRSPQYVARTQAEVAAVRANQEQQAA